MSNQQSSDTDAADWIDLRIFEDGPLAHDTATAILAMEYDCVLVDIARGVSVIGAGSEVDPESPQARPPLELVPVPELSVGPAFVPAESEAEAELRRAAGGPWALRVPADQHAELAEVLDMIIEERDTFEGRISTRRSLRTRVMQVVFALFGLLLLVHVFFTVMRGI